MQNMFKIDNRDPFTTSVAFFWCFIVSFEHISQTVLMFLLLTMKIVSKCQQAQKQLKFTCSKSAIETLEKGVKYVQS